MSICKECKWFEGHCNQELQAHRNQKGGMCEGLKCENCDGDGNHGFCRRYPPTCLFEDCEYIPIEVCSGGWCGEFLPKAPSETWNSDLSVKASNILEENKINTFEAFTKLTPKQLLNMRGCGKTTMREIMKEKQKYCEVKNLKSDIIQLIKCL